MKRSRFFASCVAAPLAAVGVKLLPKKVRPETATEVIYNARTTRGIIPFITEEVEVFWPLEVAEGESVESYLGCKIEKGNILRTYERFGVRVDEVLLQESRLRMATAKHPILRYDQRVALPLVFLDGASVVASRGDLEVS